MGIRSNLVQGNLEDFSFTVDIPRLDPSEMSGSTGNISMSTRPLPDYPFLRNQPLVIEDDLFGSASGRVSEVSESPEGLQITGETTLRRLNANIVYQAKINQSTQAAMNAALAPAGFTTSGLSNLDTQNDMPGWTGTILDFVKHFCSARNKEYYVDPANENVLVFRDIRTTSFSAKGVSAQRDTLNDQNLALTAQVIYREVMSATNESREFYPAFAESEPQILTVNPGETVEYDIRVNGWFSSFNQPEVLDFVGPEERSNDVGAYCVVGSDGLPIMASQWVATGGSLRLQLTDDPSLVKVVLTAPPVQSLKDPDGITDRFGPYSIGATSGEGKFYNSLHITGQGIRYNVHTLTFPTGAVSDVTIEEVGAVIDNPFALDLATAYNLGVRAAQVFAGPSRTLATSFVPDSNQLPDTLGSRPVYNSTPFRIESVTVTPGGLTATATADSTLGELDVLWAGKTLGEYDTLWTTKTFNEQAAVPLWRV